MCAGEHNGASMSTDISAVTGLSREALQLRQCRVLLMTACVLLRSYQRKSPTHPPDVNVLLKRADQFIAATTPARS